MTVQIIVNNVLINLNVLVAITCFIFNQMEHVMISARHYIFQMIFWQILHVMIVLLVVKHAQMGYSALNVLVIFTCNLTELV